MVDNYHPTCRNCGDANDTPERKWCFSCRLEERRRKRRQRGGDGVQKRKTNPCGLCYVDVVDAAGPTDALPGGLRVRPGREKGWLEII